MDTLHLKDLGYSQANKLVAKDITGGFCGDLLSWVMGRAKKGDVWFTVINNVNTLAVAGLVETAAVVLCQGVKPDDELIARADEQEIVLFTTDEPVFEAASKLARVLG